MTNSEHPGTVLVVQHKPYPSPQRAPYRSILVGAAENRARAGEGNFDLYDDTGEQISERNSSWCELTALYWAWKNHPAPYIGLCHYRRYFISTDPDSGIELQGARILDDEQISALLSQYKMIVPELAIRYRKTIYQHYAAAHYAHDLDIARGVIADLQPDYLAAYDRVMGGHLTYWGNMFIAPWPVFDAYMGWLMPLLFELEQRIDMSGYDAQQRRVIGYIAERLLRVWLLVNLSEDELVEIPRVNLEKAVSIKEAAVKSRRLARGAQPVRRWLRGRWFGLWD